MVRRPAALAVVVAALAVAGAACGSRASPLSHAQYEQQVNAAGHNLATQLQTVFSSIGGATSVQDIKAEAPTIRKGAEVIDGQADSLNELRPPSDAAAANAKLVGGLHELAGELRGLAAAADKLDAAKVRALLTQAQAQALPGEKAVQSAIAALRKAGYQVT